jgi:hypothetical protein
MAVTIEGMDAWGTVEGIVPVPGTALASVQVLVNNADRRFSSGSAATIKLPGAPRVALLVPTTALVRQGDLAGIRVRSGGATVTRWVRLGQVHGAVVEVLTGLAAGDTVVMPVVPAGA